MSTWALIPIKGFDRGKSRLSTVLSDQDREKLARELFEHVVGVLRASPGVDRIAVISDSSSALAHAETLGLTTLLDPPERPGLAMVVDHALNELSARGATAVIVCMSDLPELTEADVASVVRELEDSHVVLVPDRLGEGTNVLAVAPPTVLPSSFGHQDSLMRHHRRAQSLGLTVNVQLNSGIAFDLDHPNDLVRFRKRQIP